MCREIVAGRGDAHVSGFRTRAAGFRSQGNGFESQGNGFRTLSSRFGYPRTWVRVPRDLGSGTHGLGFGYPRAWVRVPTDLGSGTHRLGFGYPSSWVWVPTELGSGTQHKCRHIVAPDLRASSCWTRKTEPSPRHPFRTLSHAAAWVRVSQDSQRDPSLESPEPSREASEPTFQPVTGCNKGAEPTSVGARTQLLGYPNPTPWVPEPKFLGTRTQVRPFRDHACPNSGLAPGRRSREQPGCCHRPVTASVRNPNAATRSNFDRL